MLLHAMRHVRHLGWYLLRALLRLEHPRSTNGRPAVSIVEVRAEKHRAGWWWTATCHICRSPNGTYAKAIHHPNWGYVRHLTQPDALATALDHIAREHRTS